MAAELYELESEERLMRRKLGTKNCSDHRAVYKSFLMLQKQTAHIKKLLMQSGHIP